ncbi:unnamed protein product [Ilex paraguariensis]|uniref:Uncharacterized protein n=1 Tax=Ilex paraguariensis TaxID=185542 RepID=A0ABC8T4R1_9AQUA
MVASSGYLIFWGGSLHPLDATQGTAATSTGAAPWGAQESSSLDYRLYPSCWHLLSSALTSCSPLPPIFVSWWGVLEDYLFKAAFYRGVGCGFLWRASLDDMAPSAAFARFTLLLFLLPQLTSSIFVVVCWFSSFPMLHCLTWFQLSPQLVFRYPTGLSSGFIRSSLSGWMLETLDIMMIFSFSLSCRIKAF